MSAALKYMLAVKHTGSTELLPSEFEGVHISEFEELPEEAGYKKGGYPVGFRGVKEGDTFTLHVDAATFEAIDGELEFFYVILYDSTTGKVARYYSYEDHPMRLFPGEAMNIGANFRSVGIQYAKANS